MDITLRELEDERWRSHRQQHEGERTAVQAAFAAAEKAVEKAEVAQQAYNQRSNEFRSALDDAQKNNISRNEAEAEFQRTAERIEDARKEVRLLTDQIAKDRADFLRLDYYRTEHQTLVNRVSLLENAQSNMQGRLAVIAALATVVISFVVIGVNLVIRALGG